jgi:ABC-2 type transport system permease protein
MKYRWGPPFPFGLLWFWFLRLLPAWFGIALIIFLMQIAVAAIMHDNDNVRTFLRMLDFLPGIVKASLGGDLLNSGSISALLTIGYQHPFVLFLDMLFSVGAPAGLLTAEVQKGSMELILSRPVTKTQVYVCAAGLTMVGMFSLFVIMFLGTLVSVNIFTFDETIDLGLFFRIAMNGALLACTFAAFALVSAVSFRRLYAAVGISVAFLTLNYFISLVSQWWPSLMFLRKATLFYLVYFSRIWEGWPARNMAILAGILVVTTVVGGFIWRRRDLFL